MADHLVTSEVDEHADERLHCLELEVAAVWRLHFHFELDGIDDDVGIQEEDGQLRLPGLDQAWRVRGDQDKTSILHRYERWVSELSKGNIECI